MATIRFDFFIRIREQKSNNGIDTGKQRRRILQRSAPTERNGGSVTIFTFWKIAFRLRKRSGGPSCSLQDLV